MQTNEEIFLIIVDVINQCVGEERALKPSLKLDELGIDSIEKIEIYLEIQKYFSIKCDFKHMNSLETIEQIQHYVTVLINQLHHNKDLQDATV